MDSGTHKRRPNDKGGGNIRAASGTRSPKEVTAIILGIAILITLVVIGMAVIIDNRLINSTGYLKTFGLSADHTSIFWGDILTETDYQHTVIVNNIGNTFGTLTMVTENLPSNFTLTWDAEGYELSPYEAKIVTFTLRVNDGAQAGNFSFNIITTLAG